MNRCRPVSGAAAAPTAMVGGGVVPGGMGVPDMVRIPVVHRGTGPGPVFP